MHFGSPSDSWDQCGKAKLSYAQFIIWPDEAELRILELTSVFHQLPSVGQKQLCVLAHHFLVFFYILNCFSCYWTASLIDSLLPRVSY